MRIFRVLLCLSVGIAGVVTAAPDTSLRPVSRNTIVADLITDLSKIRPSARPPVLEPVLADRLMQQFERNGDPVFSAETGNTITHVQAFASASHQATGLSLRPFLRPNAIVKKAMAKRQERARGAICGDPSIQGEVVGFVPGKLSGCGLESGVKVRSASGISLNQHAVMDCTTASALKRWIDQGLKPAVGGFGGGVVQIRVAAHYACRTRNSQPGARISEHGKGRAIDISGFKLRDGREITLLQGWKSRDTGAILREMHRRACGVFGTVLGPESNRFHRDHFHFDTARHRSGSYCR